VIEMEKNSVKELYQCSCIIRS